jgi:hypothetical protein
MSDQPSGIAILATESIGTVLVESTSTVVVDSPVAATVFIAEPNIVVTSVNSRETVTHGQPGPPGRDGADGIAEEDMVYAKRIDFISENEIYRGEAAVGSSENATVWRIRRVVIASDSDITETWATGNAQFDKAWSDRASYTYI